MMYRYHYSDYTLHQTAIVTILTTALLYLGVTQATIFHLVYVSDEKVALLYETQRQV